MWPRHEGEAALAQRVSTEQYKIEIDHLKGRVERLEGRPMKWLAIGLGCAGPLVACGGTVLGVLGTILAQYLFR